MWGTGTPKDRDEVNRREVCECNVREVVYLFVYYEEIKRKPNRRLTCECRCDERLRVFIEFIMKR